MGGRPPWELHSWTPDAARVPKLLAIGPVIKVAVNPTELCPIIPRLLSMYTKPAQLSTPVLTVFPEQVLGIPYPVVVWNQLRCCALTLFVAGSVADVSSIEQQPPYAPRSSEQSKCSSRLQLSSLAPHVIQGLAAASSLKAYVLTSNQGTMAKSPARRLKLVE